MSYKYEISFKQVYKIHHRIMLETGECRKKNCTRKNESAAEKKRNIGNQTEQVQCDFKIYIVSPLHNFFCEQMFSSSEVGKR